MATTERSETTTDETMTHDRYSSLGVFELAELQTGPYGSRAVYDANLRDALHDFALETMWHLSAWGR